MARTVLAGPKKRTGLGSHPRREQTPETSYWTVPPAVMSGGLDSGGHFDLVDALIYMVRTAPVSSNPYPTNVGVTHATHFFNPDALEEADGLSGLIPTRFR